MTERERIKRDVMHLFMVDGEDAEDLELELQAFVDYVLTYKPL